MTAAGEVFAEHGYHAATVENIAAVAGLSKGAVYYSFGSKEDVFLALLDEKVRAWIAALDATPEVGSLSTQASRAASNYFGDVDADPAWMSLFLEFLAYAIRSERARDVIAMQFFGGLRSAIAQSTSQRTTDAGLRDVPVDKLAAGLSALTCGLSIQRAFTSGGDADEVMSVMLELLLDGLVARSERSSS